MNGESGADLLSPEVNRLSLARRCFTVLFGKGRGGSTSLWAPDLKGVSWGKFWLEAKTRILEEVNWVVIGWRGVAPELLVIRRDVE